MRESIDKVGFNRKIGSLGLMAGAVFMLAGCVGGEDTSMGNNALSAAQIKVNTPAEIAQESAAAYDDNVNGLITGNTLKRWINDWENERPAGVTGNLVILQNQAGAANSEYVKHSAEDGVFTYLVPNGAWIQTRSNNVTVTASTVPDGETVDAFLKNYAIDPANDMIVCAMGTGGYSQAMNQGRCWYMFRYWGVDSKNLAMLNGDNAWQVTDNQMDTSDFVLQAATPPGNGTASVRSLPVDNTSLQATIEDMINIASHQPENNRTNGVFIWDARSLMQYSAGEATEANYYNTTRHNNTSDRRRVAATGIDEIRCGDGSTDLPDNVGPRCGGTVEAQRQTITFQNAASRQGHPHGTLQLQYTHMLRPDEGFRYKDKAELAAYLNGELDTNGHGFVDFTYQPVGENQAYQAGDTIYAYCETTFRAMITGTVSAVILGLPTRYYDGAMTEWNSLSNITASDGKPILPVDSPWRADLDDVSYFFRASTAASVSPREVNDPYAASTDGVVRADRLYKLGITNAQASGGGVTPPSNPCGG